MNYGYVKSDELYHYGVKGMKWGKRRGKAFSREERITSGSGKIKKDEPLWIWWETAAAYDPLHPGEYGHLANKKDKYFTQRYPKQTLELGKRYSFNSRNNKPKPSFIRRGKKSVSNTTRMKTRNRTVS